VDNDMQETIWMAEQFRAGRVLNKLAFTSREEAEQFTRKMIQVEPDIFWKIEPIPLKLVWN
jgi:hypothetical protein